MTAHALVEVHEFIQISQVQCELTLGNSAGGSIMEFFCYHTQKYHGELDAVNWGIIPIFWRDYPCCEKTSNTTSLRCLY